MFIRIPQYTIVMLTITALLEISTLTAMHDLTQLSQRLQTEPTKVLALLKHAPQKPKATDVEAIRHLGECTAQDCVFNRLDGSIYRTIFEDHVVNALVKKIKNNPRQSINYVSFGSGFLFQDIVILTKTLTQQPQAHIDISCIDKKNIILGFAMDRATGSRTIRADSSLHNDQINKGVAAYLEQFPTHHPTTSYAEQLVQTCVHHQQRFQEAHAYCANVFPQAKIRWHVYEEVKTYCDHIDNRKAKNYPTVIAAIDIQDKTSQELEAEKEFVFLCSRMLSLDSQMTSILGSQKDDFQVTFILAKPLRALNDLYP